MQLKNYYYWFRSAISPEVCQKIIDLGTSKFAEMISNGEKTEAHTFGDEQKSAKPNAVPQNDQTKYDLDNIDTYVRDSEVAWLTDQWLYDLFLPYIDESNQRAGWNWDIDRNEPFQFTKYNPSGFYSWHKDGDSDWHGVYKRYIHGVTTVPLKSDGSLPPYYTTDNNLVGKVRKISMTLNLNPSGQYEGGDLKFDFGLNVPKKNRFHTCEEIRPQGSIIAFPSFLDHCVTPVTSGTRYSLVLWTLGDPWK
jgi:PKHD-type hydroxylase